MIQPDVPEISKPLYIFAICFWVISLVYVLLSPFLNLIDLSAVFALATLVEMLWSGAYRRGNAVSSANCKSDLFGRIVFASITVALALFLATFIAIFPGVPEIVDGAYVRTSHGAVMATLTLKEFQLLTLCERMMRPLLFLCFSSSLLNGIHPLYMAQHPRKKADSDS